MFLLLLIEFLESILICLYLIVGKKDKAEKLKAKQEKRRLKRKNKLEAKASKESKKLESTLDKLEEV